MAATETDTAQDWECLCSTPLLAEPVNGTSEPNVTLARANELLRNDKPGTALPALNAALRMSPTVTAPRRVWGLPRRRSEAFWCYAIHAAMAQALLHFEWRADAATHFDMALAGLSRLRERRIEAEARRRFAGVLKDLNDLDGALREFRRSQRLSRRRGVRDHHIEAFALCGIAEVRVHRGHPRRAHLAARRAVRLCVRTGDFRAEARSRHTLGIVLWVKGDLEGAASQLERAAALFGGRGRDGRYAQRAVLFDLAEVHKMRGEPTEAVKALRTVISITRKGDARKEGEAWFRLGEILEEKGDGRGAQEAYSTAKRRARKTGYHHGEAASLVSLARVEAEFGSAAKAERWLHEALRIARAEHSAARAEPAAIFGLAQLYQAQGNEVEAIAFLEQFRALAEEWNDPGSGEGAAAQLAQLYSSVGQETMTSYEEGDDGARPAAPKSRPARAAEGGPLRRLARARASRKRRVEFKPRRPPRSHPFPSPVQQRIPRSVREKSVADLRRHARVLHRQGNSGLARRELAEAHNLSRRNGDAPGQLGALTDLVVVNSDLGLAREARECVDGALAVRTRLAKPPAGIAPCASLGHLYLDRGEYLAALEFFHNLLAACGERPEEVAGEVVSLQGVAAVYKAVGLYPEALEAYAQTKRLLEKADLHDARLLGATAVGLAECQIELGRTEDASASLALGRSHRGGPGDIEMELLALNQEGRLALRRGHAKRAVEVLTEAQLRAERSSGRVPAGSTKVALGWAQLEAGHLSSAVKTLEAALREVEAAGRTGAALDAHHGLGRVHHALGNAHWARSQYASAIGIAESTRARLPIEDFRAGYFSQFGDLYADCALFLASQEDHVGAFTVVQQTKARTLRDTLARMDSRFPAKETSQLWIELVAQASALRQQLLDRATEPDHGQIAGLRRRLSEIDRSVQILEAATSQALDARVTIQAPLLGLDEIQRTLLTKEKVLLEYLLSERGSLLFVVTDDDLTALALPSRDGIERMIRVLRAAIAPESNKEPSFNAYPYGRELHDTLIMPAERWLEESERLADVNELLVSPDGQLHYLPFCLLLADEPAPIAELGTDGQHPAGINEEPPAESFGQNSGHRRSRASGAPGKPVAPDRDEDRRLLEEEALRVMQDQRLNFSDHNWELPYLSDRYVLTHIYSASSETILRGRPQRGMVSRQAKSGRTRTPPLDLLALAAPLDEDATGNTGPNHLPIPRAVREVDRIARLFPAERSVVLKREQATKPAVQSLTDPKASFRSRLIHIAAHGVLDNERPELSGIVLTPDSEGHDNIWRAFELLVASIPVDLAVLSACETGTGPLRRGEGIVSLTRSLSNAGAQSVCASLWKVADEATEELMPRLYEGLLAGLPRSEALSRAQHSLRTERKRFRHPFFWAAFTLTGEGGPLQWQRTRISQALSPDSGRTPVHDRHDRPAGVRE